jgi:hypothetical protein
LQTIDRKLSAGLDLSVIVVEFVLLEVGVWSAHHLALQIGHAESVMDALALTAFPNRVQDINAEAQRIKIEFTRSRRYHRPLSLIVIEMETENEKMTREMLRSIQHDLLSRFASARASQIIAGSLFYVQKLILKVYLCLLAGSFRLCESELVRRWYGVPRHFQMKLLLLMIFYKKPVNDLVTFHQ